MQAASICAFDHKFVRDWHACARAKEWSAVPSTYVFLCLGCAVADVWHIQILTESDGQKPESGSVPDRPEYMQSTQLHVHGL